MDFEKTEDSEIQQSIEYLESDEAVQTVSADPYWPKWHSPWWHMLLLYEMGEAHRIPNRIVEAYIDSLNRIPLKVFPIHESDMPEGVDPYRGSPCHCQLGSVYQVLAETGVDVDSRLPWIRPWFLRYQMADGGFNCDNEAYLATNEIPSSMVGTISIFEAVLLYTNREWTPAEKTFLDRAARFLINRKLVLGSDTVHNAVERESAKSWGKLCFPRFYKYDILRGLNALTLWSERTGGEIPDGAIQDAVNEINRQVETGNLRTGRLAYADATTVRQNEQGEWLRRQPADVFPLLAKVSEIGTVSPYLTRQWRNVKGRL